VTEFAVCAAATETSAPHPAASIETDTNILALKRRRNAVILGHNYMTPEIFHCVSDIVGDSLALAREAMKVDADVIVLAGVHFMAETAKLLNPSKTVLIPDTRAGCGHAGRVVGLVAAQGHDQQRYSGGQGFHHGAVATMSDDHRAVGQDVRVAYPPGDGHVGRSGDQRRVHGWPGGDEPLHR